MSETTKTRTATRIAGLAAGGTLSTLLGTAAFTPADGATVAFLMPDQAPTRLRPTTRSATARASRRPWPSYARPAR